MSELRNCPFCDEQIRVKAKKCKHCHSQVEPIVSEPNALEDVSKIDIPSGNSTLWPIIVFVVIIVALLMFLNGKETSSSNITTISEHNRNIKWICSAAEKTGAFYEPCDVDSVSKSVNFSIRRAFNLDEMKAICKGMIKQINKQNLKYMADWSLMIERVGLNGDYNYERCNLPS